MEEQVHMRPGHFWAARLGDADGKGSPILAGPFKARTCWPPQEGEAGWKADYKGIERQRYDVGECAILLQCYYHRTVDDPEGLTFVLWKTKRGERLVVNSCELRAVQGRQECDFKLTLPQPPPPLRQQLNRVKKKQRPQDGTELFDPKARWRLERELDGETRVMCCST
mmetsp:Transcript_15096/g.47537  ORF Transcript_15096/g.47537 Transcript_15096/m.47537 type:complete len:168 (+) Transcript_15096:507-1010(+)